MQTTGESVSRLWAITSYFNPAGYRRKLQNYRVFRQRLNVPLVAVELSQSGLFELRPEDADILVQLRGGDVMWQKERLLNIAIMHLPNECAYVAWLDCDIVFQREDWGAAAVRELDRAGICHLFHTVHHVRRDTPHEAIGCETSNLRHESIGYACASGIRTSVAAVTDGVPGVFKRGHGWCARRELLEEHGLYDRNVLGSGDKLIAFAATGQEEEVIARDSMAPGHAADYREWASKFRRSVQRIGYIEGDIFHLWHGDLERRQYTARYRVLGSAGYDPASDIALDAEKCWRWNSPKPDMHRKVREYFEQRDEDGERRAG